MYIYIFKYNVSVYTFFSDLYVAVLNSQLFHDGNVDIVWFLRELKELINRIHE